MQTEADLPVRKIYFSSKERAYGTSSNWVSELPFSLSLPDNTIAWVTDLSLPHSWWSVDSHNNKLFLLERWETTGGSQLRRFTEVTLPSQNYDVDDMETQLKIALDAATQIPGIAGNPTTYTVTHQPSKNNFLITVTSVSTDAGFRFVPDVALKDTAFRTAVAGTYSQVSPPTANDVVGVHDYDGAASALLVEWLQVGNMGTSFSGGFCDMRRFHNIFLHSSALSTFKTIGPQNSSTVIRRIPVTTAYSDILYSEGASHQLDYLEAPRDIRTLDFQVKDAKGRDVNLQGCTAGISFSIIFAEKN